MVLPYLSVQGTPQGKKSNTGQINQYNHVTRLLLYIFFLFAPLALFAQEDTDTTYTEDPPKIEEFVEAAYSAPKEAATPVPLPKYADRKFTPGLEKRYTGNDFDYKPRPEAENGLTRFFAWVRRILRALFGSTNNNKPDHSGTDYLMVFYKVMGIIVILGVVYFIARAVLQKEGVWIFGRSGKKIIATDVDAENIHEMDFATLIEKTKSDEDYRLAVRYYYLWLLKKLSAREIISWNWDKTNTDYYYEIKDNNLRDDFKYLSYLYDYSWYGEFEIDEKAFGKAEKAFRKTINTL